MNTQTPLISVEELASIRTDQILLVDCRFALADPVQGARDYAAAHVPGAVYASLDRDLSDLTRKDLGRHPLPHPDAFAATLGRWGWQPGMPVVAYDADWGAMAAARLWWMMRLIEADARVLDGGLAAWQAAGQPVEAGQVTRAPTRVAVGFDKSQLLYTPLLREELAQDAIVLIDARAPARFRGEVEPMDPVAGHVPGALNAPFADNLDARRHWHSPEDLRKRFETVLNGRDPSQVVHMCGSGVTACHNLLAMEQAGLHGSRLYAPSWSGWIADKTNPVATGAV